MLLLALLVGLSGLSDAAPVEPLAGNVEPPFSLDEILDALRTTESGGYANEGRDATGDGGLAIGPFQIHRGYFIDSGVDGRYEDCRDPEYARGVVLAYWRRWCPDALERRDAEVLARVHNGGPRGAHKPSTLVYWRKVESRLMTMADRGDDILVAVAGAAGEETDKRRSGLATGVESPGEPPTSKP